VSAATLDLVFDGQCGFCTRAINWIKRVDRHERIRVHPFQQAGIHERFDLSTADTQAAAWAITSDRRASGAGSINLALDTALGIGFFSAIYRIRGIRWLQDRTYIWVSNHRYLLRGVTPWCNSHPEGCELAVEGATCSLPKSGERPACST
jgi:predicted DCC family thiol-disulfide oxidoreductase YuxK